MRSGYFIVLEGIDGSGKTTIAKELKTFFINKKANVLITQEPTKGNIGNIIREYLMNTERDKRNPIFEALAFAADRAWHIENLIKPYLEKGYLIICDRYYYSSFAYQIINGLESKWLIEINKYMLKPDLALFLDVRPEVAIKRIKHPRNIFECIHFLKKVYTNYMKMVDSNMLIRVNGERKIESIIRDITKIIDAKWK